MQPRDQSMPDSESTASVEWECAYLVIGLGVVEDLLNLESKGSAYT